MRRSSRAPAAPPARLSVGTAPPFWLSLLQHASLRKVHARLLTASDEDIAKCIAWPRAGVLTFVIRLAGVRVPEKSKGSDVSKAHAKMEEELLTTVRLALDRGLSPDQSAQWAEAEIFTPPLVAAASYDFQKVVELLLEHGADPMQRNSDMEVAMHVSAAHQIIPCRCPTHPGVSPALQVAVDRPSALRQLMLLPHDSRAKCLAAANRSGRTPFTAALLREQYKPIHAQACRDMAAAGALISDGEFTTIRSLKRLPRLIDVAATPDINHPKRLWHRTRHWSFPASDRVAVRMTYELAHRGHAGLPPELWLVIFGTIERGWFALDPAVVPPPALGAAAAAVAAQAIDVRRAQIHEVLRQVHHG